MSEKNQEGKRAARERMAEQRDLEQSRDKRRKVLIVGVSIVAVLGIAAGVGVLVNNNSKSGGSTPAASTDGPVVVPKGAGGKDDLAIPVGKGDAPSTLTVWEDFRCPACGTFENAFRDTIHELEGQGQLKVDYHLATIIDGNMGGSGSLRAANAAACAQGAGKFPAYHDVLYKNQPEETDDAFAKNSHLIDLAGQVDGLVTDSFKKCVDAGTHNSWVAKSNKAFTSGDFTGTPTILLNGDSIFPKKGDESITPDNLKKWVQEANKGKKAGTASPSA